MTKLTHIDDSGNARMVDVGTKADTQRTAIAGGYIEMSSETLSRIVAGDAPKGDVIGPARIAGIMAAKKTAELIPLCHPLALNAVDISIHPVAEKNRLQIEAKVSTTGKTGVEMEALTAVSVAALTLYDMAKALDKTMTIGGICLLSKTGGKSGTYQADPAP